MLIYRNYIVIGIDVSSKFHVASAIDPDGRKLFSNFKFDNNFDGIGSFIKKINELKQSVQTNIVCALESTGAYHLTLLKSISVHGFENILVNPLITNSSRKSTVRKVKNDNFDTFAIIDAVRNQDFKPSIVASSSIMALRQFVRDYYTYSNECTKYKLKLRTLLDSFWNEYSSVFSNISNMTSLTLLKSFPSPKSIIEADKSDIIDILLISKKGLKYANSAYDKLLVVCQHSLDVFSTVYFDCAIRQYVDTIINFEATLNNLKQYVTDFINSDKCDSKVRTNLDLLISISGIGPISAITVLAEISDFSSFKNYKKIIAFFGMDPKVVQSGQFTAKHTPVTKCGSHIARRAIYTIALRCISKTRNGVLINSNIRSYYDAKCVSKAKKVALGHVMHKVVSIMFSVIKNQKPYELITKDEHISRFNLQKTA